MGWNWIDTSPFSLHLKHATAAGMPKKIGLICGDQSKHPLTVQTNSSPNTMQTDWSNNPQKMQSNDMHKDPSGYQLADKTINPLN